MTAASEHYEDAWDYTDPEFVEEQLIESLRESLQAEVEAGVVEHRMATLILHKFRHSQALKDAVARSIAEVSQGLERTATPLH